MSNESTAGPKPRRARASPAIRRARPAVTPRAPLDRARTWARTHWDAARDKVSQTEFKAPKFKKPSRKAMYWTGGVLAGLAIVIAILIAIWDWNWFRGPMGRLASARMHREVTISGDLKVDIFSWQPSATIDGVRIANPAWRGAEPMANIERIAVRIRLVPLFRGQTDLRLLRFDRPNINLYRDAQGRANWDFSDGRKSEPLRLPPIRSFIINEGKLTYNDVKRGLTFSGSINASERLGAENEGFRMVGAGSLNREAFTLRVTGGPLLNIERDKPYPFDADIRAGDTYVTARGAIPKPFDMGQFYMNLTARGPDLASLYGLTGVALPNTPPYSLNGRLTRDQQLYKITGLNGRVGDSDLAGELSVNNSDARPMLKADLRSKSLDFDDLGAIFGGAPATGPGETKNAGQVVMARQMAAQQRLFPDTTLAVDRIRAIDADVTYKALTIRDAPIRLRAAQVRVRLDNGMLRANPLKLDLPQGHIAGFVNLDARKATPVTSLDLRLTNARIEQLIPVTAGGLVPLTGALTGRAQLTGAGNSVHKAFANADGEVLVVVPGGEIREAFAELLGINVVKGLGLLLSKNEDKVPVHCAVAHFQANDGVLNARHIVFDTGPVLGKGSGTVNLNTERMSFRIDGKAKKFRLVRLLSPVTITGPIRSPKFGVEAGKVVAQGGVAVALGVLINPLAAIIPFIDPGLAKDANCGALIASAGREGVPVTASRR
ncbi:AsmA family protein [Phenylobacterium sp.]|uniref:AsmA family protein n=1 Tax=Phenylobacterium sp. TaxID=1871053 RepID=UPI0039832580